MPVTINGIEYLTTKDAAKLLGVSVRRVRQLAGKEIPAQKIGRDWFFSPETVKQVELPGRGWPKGKLRKDPKS